LRSIMPSDFIKKLNDKLFYDVMQTKVRMMKVLKFFAAMSAAVLLALVLYGVQRYNDYEAQQDDVRRFQQLALQGYGAVNAGKSEAAIGYYEAAIGIHDRDAASLSDLATLYRGQGRIEAAGRLYAQAYAAEPDSYRHLYHAALCDYLQQRYDDAAQKATELMHRDRKRGKYYRLLAASRFGAGKREEALGYYAVIVQRESDRNDTLLQDVQRAYAALEHKPEPHRLTFAYEETDDVGKLAELMRRYEREGYDIKALRTAQKILEITPGHDEAHKMAARLFYAHDAMNEAYRHASAVGEHDAESLEILGGTHQSFGEHDAALEAYERSYAMQPKKELLRAMAVCAFHGRRFEAMLVAIGRLEQYDPQLAHRVAYAIETEGGVEHGIWEKLSYLITDDLLGLYCDFRGCHDA
jgi:tetratricopeptide (TPR) repeat protein